MIHRNRNTLKRLDEIEEAFKRKEREKWSRAERAEILKRGEQPADFFHVWLELVRLWAMKDWLGKYHYLPKSHKDKIKEWEQTLKYFL